MDEEPNRLQPRGLSTMSRTALTLLVTAFLLGPASADEPQAPPKATPKESPPTEAAPKSDGFYEVEVTKDQAYRDDKEAHPVKHKLDLYLPKGVKDYPVMMFVHGGAWASGRKELYGTLGALFARNGIGTAVINYRLSSGDKPAK